MDAGSVGYSELYPCYCLLWHLVFRELFIWLPKLEDIPHALECAEDRDIHKALYVRCLLTSGVSEEITVLITLVRGTL